MIFSQPPLWRFSRSAHVDIITRFQSLVICINTGVRKDYDLVHINKKMKQSSLYLGCGLTQDLLVLNTKCYFLLSIEYTLHAPSINQILGLNIQKVFIEIPIHCTHDHTQWSLETIEIGIYTKISKMYVDSSLIFCFFSINHFSCLR